MFDDASPAFDTYIHCHFAETFLDQTCTRSKSGLPRAKKTPLLDTSNIGETTMIASYQFIINVVADYIEIVMLTIGMIVFLASE
jgi:hypothetical protein